MGIVEDIIEEVGENVKISTLYCSAQISFFM